MAEIRCSAQWPFGPIRLARVFAICADAVVSLLLQINVVPQSCEEAASLAQARGSTKAAGLAHHPAPAQPPAQEIQELLFSREEPHSIEICVL